MMAMASQSNKVTHEMWNEIGRFVNDRRFFEFFISKFGTIWPVGAFENGEELLHGYFILGVCVQRYPEWVIPVELLSRVWTSHHISEGRKIMKPSITQDDFDEFKEFCGNTSHKHYLCEEEDLCVKNNCLMLFFAERFIPRDDPDWLILRDVFTMFTYLALDDE
jgi:hypothetical protein